MASLFMTAFVLNVPEINAQVNLGKLKDKVKKDKGSENTNVSSSETNSETTNASSLPAKGGIVYPTVSSPVISFSSTYTFANKSESLSPKGNIFLRLTTPKPIGEAFKDALGTPNVPGNGKLILAIAKDINDEKPIVIYPTVIMTSRYTKTNFIDLTLQADEKTMAALESPSAELQSQVDFNSIGTLAPRGLKDAWMNAASTFPDGDNQWECFVFFAPYNGEGAVQIAAQKFTYTTNADSRSDLAANMNFYDKQRFEKTPDDGITTEIHKANVGKIVFAQNTIPRESNDKSALKSDFTNFSNGIYARMYMKQSVRNFLAENGNGKDVGTTGYAIEIWVDGKKIMNVTDKLDGEDANKRTNWQIVLAPNKKEDEFANEYITGEFAYCMSTLADGKHEIKLRAFIDYDNKEQTLSEGSFTVNITKADRDKFVKEYGFRLRKPGHMDADPQFASEVKKLVHSSVKTIRCPLAWEDRVDMFDRVTHRVTYVETGFIDDDGSCRAGMFLVQQMKTSDGWGPTEKSNESTSKWGSPQRDVPCQNFDNTLIRKW
ncbi:MAG TPA: hypothetical protein VD905_04800 [Flavobacteriales bacterium]|nr:hypothetical protein [Flavobacteriales bacterium]